MRSAIPARTGFRSTYAIAASSAASVNSAPRVEARVVEVAAGAALLVGAPRDRLLEVLHEVRERAERPARPHQTARIAEQQLARLRLALLDDLAPLRRRERVDPAPRHLLVAPAPARQRVVAGDEVEVVAHDAVGVDLDGEAAGEELDAVDEPLLAVRVVASGAGVASAEEGALHAARHDVVVAGVDGVDQESSGSGHGGIVAARCRAVDGKTPRPAVGHRPGVSAVRGEAPRAGSRTRCRTWNAYVPDCLLSGGARLEARYTASRPDGRPVLASVKLLDDGWTLA